MFTKETETLKNKQTEFLELRNCKWTEEVHQENSENRAAIWKSQQAQKQKSRRDGGEVDGQHLSPMDTSL